MAKKLFAVFLVCLAVLAAVQVDEAAAAGEQAEQQFKNCYNSCHEKCFQDGKANGYTFCEMKCDADCGADTIKTTLDSNGPKGINWDASLLPTQSRLKLK